MPRGVYERTQKHLEQLTFVRRQRKNYVAWNKGLTKEIAPQLKGGHPKGVKLGGHQKGVKLSESHKMKLRKKRPSISGDANPSKRPEVREKISKSLKGKFIGRKMSLEVREKISKNAKRLYGDDSPTKRPEVRAKIREKRLHQVFPIKDTSIERALQKVLQKEGIKFEPHKPIFGQPDIFIRPNICVFADGDYWHSLPHYKERDSQVNEQLRKEGYVVLRFSESQINHNMDECLNLIREVIKPEQTPVKMGPLLSVPVRAVVAGQVPSLKQEAPRKSWGGSSRF